MSKSQMTAAVKAGGANMENELRAAGRITAKTISMVQVDLRWHQPPKTRLGQNNCWSDTQRPAALFQ